MGPLKFIPLLKRTRWGGRRLGEVLGKHIGIESDYAESWEVCDHGTDQSLVAAGDYTGWTLRDLVHKRAAELLGRHSGESQFPLLIKFLDVHDRLSIQVHPNDEQAGRFLPGERGKMEAWVILAAQPRSCVFAGLKPGTTLETLRQAIQCGSLESCLNRVEVAPGDCLLIPAGTVHAIGEGILLAEVQQSSDLTFRLYDWNRVGADGLPRQLHVDQALACTDFGRGLMQPVIPVLLPTGGKKSERLAECRYFAIHRHTIDQPLSFPDDNRCRIIIAVEGAADCTADHERLHLGRGETILIPAAGQPARLDPRPHAVVLEVFW
jgi:mannose-6-phosphate isomerase